METEKMETEKMETEKMETEETTVLRPSTLSISTPDDALDMSANNTLSFVFTQPPKLFTVNVCWDSVEILSLVLIFEKIVCDLFCL